MFLAILIVISLALIAIYISFLILPGNISGLGFDVIGDFLAIMVSLFVFYRMILLGKHFGFKDNGMNEESTFIGKIWVPLAILVALTSGIITSKLLA